MTNLWDIPPRQRRGDLTYDEIWRSVGQALTRWEEVETAMTELYSAIVSPTDVWSPLVPPAVRAYGAILGSRSRLDMVRAAANEFLFQRSDEGLTRDPTLGDDLKTLLAKAHELANRRNDFAHGVVMPHIFEDGGHNGHYLYPGLYASKKWKKAGFIGGEAAYAYTAAQIDEFANQFDQLRFEIEAFPDRFFRMQQASAS